MKILNISQGSKKWLEERLAHFTASEAPMMMNASKYFTRNQLLDHKKGWITSVDEFTQKLFDEGHSTEDTARSLLEFETMQSFSPIVATLVDDLPLMASLDGITEDHKTIFEHKLWNETLAENVRNNVLEPTYYWQLEQQLLVTGAERALFVVSDGSGVKREQMYYTSQPERRKELIAGWKQFAKDLAKHEVKAKEEKLVATELQALPKLEISLIGNVSNSNLAVYKSTALAFIKSVNTELCSDQDFVDADKAVKFFASGEKELEAVKERALSDTADIKTLFDTIDELKEEMRQKRLTLSKLVKSRKEEIRSEISFKAKTEFSELLIATSKSLNGIQIHQVTVDFDNAMKGKKTVESLQNAVDSEMARAKIELSEIADLVRSNLNSLSELASDFKFLFNDHAHIVFKDNDDLINLVKSRIAEHKTAEAAKLEAQREQMRLEEEAKAKAKVEAEAARKAQMIENDLLLKEREAQAAHEEKLQAERPEFSDREFTSNEPLQPLPIAQRLAERFADTSEQELGNAIEASIESPTRKQQYTYEPLGLWPSDYDVSQNDELARVCQKLEEAEAYIESLTAVKAA